MELFQGVNGKKKTNLRSESLASGPTGPGTVQSKFLKPTDKKEPGMLKMAKFASSKQSASIGLGTPVRGPSELQNSKIACFNIVFILFYFYR